MALEIHWYDGVCFAIVGVALIASLYVIWRKEGAGRNEGKSLYESLLIPRPDSSTSSSGSNSLNILSDQCYSGALPIGHVSSDQLWTSCWRRLHPAWLLATRLLSLFVLAAFLSWDLHDWGASIFFYYTEGGFRGVFRWTFALVMMYFAIGSVVSAHGCWVLHTEVASLASAERSEVGSGRDLEENVRLRPRSFMKKLRAVKLQSHYSEEQALHRAGFWGYLIQTAYQTCAGAVFFTDIVFWCIIVPFLSNTHLRLNLLMGFMHTVNAALLLLDTSLNRLPFPWFRLAYFVLWSAVYVIFQWVIHLCGFTWWPYPFLELSTPWAPLWYLILALFHVACYGFYALIVRFKNLIFSKLFPHSYLRAY